MKLYDTLSRKKKVLAPDDGGIKMYVCGITPYGPAHIGHALSYVTFDVIRRYLEYRGYPVSHIQNFTDVDDKIIDKAKKEGISCGDLTRRYIEEYFVDMDALGVKRADEYPKVTDEIADIVKMIQVLIDKGYAYQASSDVYFNVRNSKGYGKLSGRSLDSMLSGQSVEQSSLKNHPMDFALWKGAKPGEPSWDSPWGDGRPGWHIECSSMAYKYLGESIHIHGGGQDLVFPHHENEIAQTEGYTGVQKFAEFWMHNGLLNMGEDKMSKSLGNLVTIRDALKQFSPDVIRLFILASHYRSPVNYSEELLTAQERALERLIFASQDDENSKITSSIDFEMFERNFCEAMDDDINTPQALAVIFELSREINRAKELGADTAKERTILKKLTGLLGLTLESKSDTNLEVAPFVDLILDIREELRNNKQWDLSDKLRNKLMDLGISVEDSDEGSTWKLS